MTRLQKSTSTLYHVCAAVMTQQQMQLTQHLTSSDAILLSQDGVYQLQSQLKLSHSANCKLYYIGEDLAARGLNHIAKEVEHIANAITYPEFVQLCIDYDNTIKWG